MKRSLIFTIILLLIVYNVKAQETKPVEYPVEIKVTPCKCMPMVYQFEAIGKKEIIKFAWSFGDKSSSTDNSPKHGFQYSDNYDVCVKVVFKDATLGTGCISQFFEGKDSVPAPHKGTGTVKDYTGLDGCGLVIALDNDVVLEPAEIVPNFLLKEGQRVHLVYSYLKDRASICMVGPLVKILEIAEIPRDSLITPNPQCKVGINYDILKTNPPLFQFKASSESKIISWYWDFNDGSTSNEQFPMHTFKNWEISSSGIFKVCLKAITVDSCIVKVCNDVYMNGGQPPDACKAGFTWIHPGDWTVPNPKNFKFTDNSYNKPIRWDWSFGDGTFSKEQNPFHKYEKDGIYEVCLKMATESGCSSYYCEKVATNDSLIKRCNVNFIIESLNRDINTFGFVPSTDFNADKYYWEFGEGSSSYDSLAIHKYNQPGVYKVCLTAASKQGCANTYCQDVYVGVDLKCYVDFDFAVMESWPVQVAFKPIVNEKVEYYYWEFGDGTDSYEAYPTHTYPNIQTFAPVEYKACLTVATVNGCKTTVCKVVINGGGIIDDGRKCNNIINLAMTDVSSNGLCDGRASVKLIDMFGIEIKNVVFTWSTGIIGSSVTNLCPDAPYSVVAVDEKGCKVGAAFSLFSVLPKDMVVPYIWDYKLDGSTYLFNIPQGTPSANYEWDFGDGNKAVGSNVEYAFSQPGNYSVSLKVEDNGKEMVYTKEINVIATGMSNQDFKERVKIYPIPAADKLNLDLNFKSNDGWQLNIFNISGQRVYGQKISNFEKTFVIDIKALPKGTYILTLINKDKTVERKFVK